MYFGFVSTMLVGMVVADPVPDVYDLPVVDGEWWTVAHNPDLGEYTRKEQQPVDFAVWRAGDGTWQLWSCIRHTGCGGHTRLFYRWEGPALTDSDWKPMGIAMEARPDLGESPGGLQAPHVVRHDGKFWMAYGDWENICFATSDDGKSFARRVQPNGKTGVFTEGPGKNTRDPMLIKIDGRWHCYYTATSSNDRLGYALCRTSPDLESWSRSIVVSYGGRIGGSPWQNECPHVVEVRSGAFCFFRNQYYGRSARNWVYHSNNPLNFGIDDDSFQVGSLAVAAPEIILHEGKHYIASLRDDLQGIKIARLKWTRYRRCAKPVFDFDDPDVRGRWRLEKGDLATVFTTSKRVRFGCPSRHFIGTAERKDGTFDDDRTGEILSPSFSLTQESCMLLISGGFNRETLYVVIEDARSGDEITRLTGGNHNVLQRVTVSLHDHVGKRVRIRVVDAHKGSWGHINFGGIFVDAPESGMK